MKKIVNSDLFLILLLSLLSCILYLPKGMPEVPGLNNELTRVAEYVHSMRGVIFPVRWAANLDGGYGQPIFNFYSPLFLIVSSLQVFLGLSIIQAVKGSVLLFTFMGGVGIYYFTREFFGREGAHIALIVFFIFPYRYVDLYIRAAFAEYTALCLAPFVLYGLFLMAREKSFCGSSFLLLIISGTMFVLSHNLSLLMYAPIFILFFLVNVGIHKNWMSIIRGSLAGLIIFCLSAFFLLPVLLEKKYIQHGLLLIGQLDYTKHFSSLSSLFWFSRVYSLTPFFLIILCVIFLVIIFKHKIIPKNTYLNLYFLFSILIIAFFMITPQSTIIYKHVSYLQYLQFPWRWLSPVMVITSVLSGSISFLSLKNSMDKNNSQQNKSGLFVNIILIFVVFSAALALLNMSDIRKAYVYWPNEYFRPENIRAQNLRATYLAEYRPVWVTEEPDIPIIRVLKCESNGAQFDFSENKKHSILRHYKIMLEDKCLITANIHYFPGWRVYHNDQPVPFEVTQRGLISFELPKGAHDIQIVFEETFVRKLGNAISLIGLAAMALMLFFHYSMRKRIEKH
jgi:hypothetical protein